MSNAAHQPQRASVRFLSDLFSQPRTFRDRFRAEHRTCVRGQNMAESNMTRPSLLVQIRDAQNEQAWSQFVDLYAPLIYGFARKQGLQDADAADLTQEVLRTVAKSVQGLEYDPARGSFRGWLFTIVRNK